MEDLDEPNSGHPKLDVFLTPFPGAGFYLFTITNFTNPLHFDNITLTFTRYHISCEGEFLHPN